jgi:hypothetical protein
MEILDISTVREKTINSQPIEKEYDTMISDWNNIIDWTSNNHFGYTKIWFYEHQLEELETDILHVSNLYRVGGYKVSDIGFDKYFSYYFVEISWA